MPKFMPTEFGLAETAESMTEVNKQRAEEALKKAEAKLLDPMLQADQIEAVQRKLRRAQARLSASSHDTH